MRQRSDYLRIPSMDRLLLVYPPSAFSSFAYTMHASARARTALALNFFAILTGFVFRPRSLFPRPQVGRCR
jgi:hypothetical protein